MSGIALMLDGVVDAIDRGRVDDAKEILARAVSRQRRRSASCATSRSRSSRSSSATRASGRPCRRSPTRSRFSQGVVVDLDVDAADAGEPGPDRALPDHPRVPRRRPAARAADPHLRGIGEVDGGAVETLITDDGSGERRRGSSRRWPSGRGRSAAPLTSTAARTRAARPCASRCRPTARG